MYILVAITAVIGGLVILALRLDSYLQDKVNTSESTTTEQTSAYFASSNKVFTTEYFQIQAPKNWAAIPSESTDTMFVYRGINEPIVEDELIIYVNSIPASLTATRLLPVELSGGGQELSPGSVSEHCNEASEDDNIDTKVLTYKKVSINCDVDNTQFNVLVGAVGGSTRMNLNRPDGTVADYSILYRNIQAIPDASTIIQIMQSFQTR
ncbi:MAG TPA: hypothetical protein VFX79_02055 [Candidatus Saccharimonadales bacterium]|nr:hypothetical protein [Candidatus Saccharimonadales bacterium]